MTQVRRHGYRLKANALFLLWRSVPSSRRLNLQCAGTCGDATTKLMTVADDEPSCCFILPVLGRWEEFFGLRFQGRLHHPASSIVNSFIERTSRVELCSKKRQILD